MKEDKGLPEKALLEKEFYRDGLDNNPVVAEIKNLSEEKQKFVAEYIYSLALLSFKTLTPPTK